MAGESDPTEIDSPASPKIESKAETTAEAPPGFFFAGERLLPRGRLSDPEYRRQCDIFYEQFEKSEGFDVDWDNLDYQFAAINFAWEQHYDTYQSQSKEEFLKLLTQAAIDEFNEKNGTDIEFVEHVSANAMPCKGFVYYITFWATDVSSEPKLYQAKVQKFGDEISVVMVRLRPTQD